MKTIYQILIVIFITTSLFLAKDDFLNVFNESISYLEDKISSSEKDNESIINSEIKNKEREKAIELPPMDTPGALKIPDKIFNNNTELSMEGIINITNNFRAENGNLSPLKENPKLDFSAEKKLQDMFTKQYFEHTSPEGVGVGDLGDQISYEYITIGENLALGNFGNDYALVEAWMNSPGHRENILNNHYQEIGVAVGKGFFEGKSVWMAVQHFGLPKSICPATDEVLHGIILINEKEVKSMEEDLAIRREKIESRAVYEDLTTNEQIDKYNSLVLVYNELINKLKKQILEYNKQIQEFNSCINENTTPTH